MVPTWAVPGLFNQRLAFCVVIFIGLDLESLREILLGIKCLKIQLRILLRKTDRSAMFSGFISIYEIPNIIGDTL